MIKENETFICFWKQYKERIGDIFKLFEATGMVVEGKMFIDTLAYWPFKDEVNYN